MSKFSQLDADLRRAGYVLLAEVLGGALIGAVLFYLRLETEPAVLFVWAANLPAAWFLAKAAKHQGRNTWITGFTSLPPMLAAVNFWLLWAAASSYRSNQAS